MKKKEITMGELNKALIDLKEAAGLDIRILYPLIGLPETASETVKKARKALDVIDNAIVMYKKIAKGKLKQNAKIKVIK